MSLSLRLVTLGLILGLVGCSTLSQEECKNSDWYALGYKDGQAGKLLSQLQRYSQNCAEYGLHPDAARWQSGYAKGLEYYCIPELAYAKGLAGETYQGVCPNDASFLARYRQGYQEYRFNQAIEQELLRIHSAHDMWYERYLQSDDEIERHRIQERLDHLDWMEQDLRFHRLRAGSP